MVARSVNRHGLAIQFANDAAHVSQKSRFPLRLNAPDPSLRAEDHVCQQIREGLGHLLSPLRGLLRL